MEVGRVLRRSVGLQHMYPFGKYTGTVWIRDSSAVGVFLRYMFRADTIQRAETELRRRGSGAAPHPPRHLHYMDGTASCS